jgi:cell division protease FtsH
MFDDNSNPKNGDKKQPPGGGGMKNSTFTLLAWAGIIAAAVALFVMRSRVMTSNAITLTQAEFLSKFASNQIAQATIDLNSQASTLMPVTGKYFDTKDGKQVEVPFVTPNAYFSPNKLEQLFDAGNVEPGAPNAMLMNLVWGVAPFLILGVLFWFFFIRQIKIAGKGALSFGKSKARMLAKDRNKTTFKDVAGVDEAIEEVSELVEFLKDPKNFSGSVDAFRRAF